MIKQKYLIGLCLLSALMTSGCSESNTANSTRSSNNATLVREKLVLQTEIVKLEEQQMSQLTEAILKMDLTAVDLASTMQGNAIPELTELLKHEDSAVRTVTVLALGVIMHPKAHDLLFHAVEDEDINVSGAAITQIQRQAESITTEQLVTLLDKVKEPNTLKQLILSLGARLDSSQVAILEPFCQQEQDKIVVVACIAAIAKIGVQSYRKKFSQHFLMSSGPQLNIAFSLVDYIHQPWLIPHLQQQLHNKAEIQSLGDLPPPMPNTLRVCDKAVVAIAKLSGVSFSFDTQTHANFNDQQLHEVINYPFNYSEPLGN